MSHPLSEWMAPKKSKDFPGKSQVPIARANQSPPPKEGRGSKWKPLGSYTAHFTSGWTPKKCNALCFPADLRCHSHFPRAVPRLFTAGLARPGIRQLHIPEIRVRYLDPWASEWMDQTKSNTFCVFHWSKPKKLLKSGNSESEHSKAYANINSGILNNLALCTNSERNTGTPNNTTQHNTTQHNTMPTKKAPTTRQN